MSSRQNGFIAGSAGTLQFHETLIRFLRVKIEWHRDEAGRQSVSLLVGGPQSLKAVKIDFRVGRINGGLDVPESIQLTAKRTGRGSIALKLGAVCAHQFEILLGERQSPQFHVAFSQQKTGARISRRNIKHVQ